MQQPSPAYPGTKPPGSSAWNELFMGFVLVTAIVLLVTVIGRAALAAMVWWEHGSIGYAKGIRVHFVGKAPWFTSGEPVPGSLAVIGSLVALAVSIMLSYIMVSCARHIYRRFRGEKHAGT